MTDEPKRYVERALVAEAMRWDGSPSGAQAVMDWLSGFGVDVSYLDYYQVIHLSSRQGVASVLPGNWLIYGSLRFSVMREEEFERAYEEVKR